MLRKSLRAVCSKQAEWPRPLQAVAMAYRAAATTNTSVSPYEVMFGRPMPLSIDWAMITSVEQYAREASPTLEAMYRVAVENVTRSAARLAQRQDRNAAVPDYAAGNKVLMHNPTTKNGESPKFKRRYPGLLLIVECKPGFNYRLQHYDTGRRFKRLVHAKWLKPYFELDNDYRPTGN